jgi:hypothetical protein
MGIRLFLILGSLVAPSAAAVAHHSFAPFDQTRQITLKGEVLEFQWTNPHAWLILKVKGATGPEEEWSVEMISPNILGRMGWKKNSLKGGDEVTVTAHPAKDGAHFGLMIDVVGSNGRPVVGEAE